MRTLVFITMCLMLSLCSTCAFAQKQELLVPTEQMQLSVNLGVGVITNPLNGADNLPLVLVPHIAYYAQQWFFDNGRVGYSFLQTPKHTISFVSEINPESRFFIDWHPQNIFSLKSNAVSPSLAQFQENESPKQININTIKTRRIALDAGVSYFFVDQKNVFSTQILHDINNVYNNWRGSLQWQRLGTIGVLRLKSTVGIDYKSASLNNYFYGLQSSESALGKIEVGRSWQPYAKVDARLSFSKVNALRFHLAYYDYSALADSPLFEHNYSMTAFIGFEHIF